MTEKKLMEWLVENLECYDCPVMEECRTAKPATCSGMLNSMLRASDDVVMVALNSQVQKIRKAKENMHKETDPVLRMEMLHRIDKMRSELRDVRKYIGKRN